jgi:hypothetical protein
MTDLPDELHLIQVEATRFRSAVSEDILQTMGKTSNFLANRTYEEKQFFLNGRYAIVVAPQTGLDGLVFFQYDAVIIDAWAFNIVPGSGGTTELDIKRATTPGGTFTSIFTTTPKFTSAASAYSWVDALGIVPAGTGVTAPVLDPAQLNVNAGDALRIDKLQNMLGTPENCGIIITFRSR